MINWINCISAERTGKSSGETNRTHFQRDYDRLIFSSAFRRLQNKTQVFPLPGNTFVHNRLTHTLEVASVGRSLGAIVGQHLSEISEVKSVNTALQFYQYDLSSVIAAACLAHDVGNPPFGHSGEKAISMYFIDNQCKDINRRQLIDYFDEKQWTDLIHFEGNANAFHIMTYAYEGKLQEGMQLTYSTLASILKYPCEAKAIDKNFKHRKKFGCFQLDKMAFDRVIQSTNMLVDAIGNNMAYKRHPFVYLVEAADDICYRIIDLEDAHRIGIIDTATVKQLLLDCITDFSNATQLKKVNQNFKSVTNSNEQIAYLRAKCISALIFESSNEFIMNKDAIIAGIWNHTLMDNVEKRSPALKEINELSIKKIYDHHSVIEVEIAGYKVMSEILDIFITASLSEIKSPLQQKTLLLLPEQFKKTGASDYEKVMNILDYVAGMTDGYAMEMYRNFKGIEIAKHN